jgi:serine/threonine protein kinase
VILEGQILDGTYHLRRLVGEGGMGVVYEATHARLAGRYAIKVLGRSLSDSPDALARFVREARITSLLQHPNVVQVIDHNTTADGNAYLVMEYLGGESLAERLARQGHLPLEDVVDIVEQIAAGLAAAHGHGIVHRDLKPDNVYLVPVEGHETELVKILDFGISKVNWGRPATENEVCGTPQYMAPEQVEGRTAEVDGATDQFALAVIAYELLTGRNPFMAENIHQIFSRVVREVAAPTGIREEVDAVLARGMAKLNGLRFPSVMDFAAAFREAALPRALTLLQTPPAITNPDERGVRVPDLRRSRRPRWGLALGFAAAAGAGAFLFVNGETAKMSSWLSALLSAPSAVAASAVDSELGGFRPVSPMAAVPPAPSPGLGDDSHVDATPNSMAVQPEPIRAATLAVHGRAPDRAAPVARFRRPRHTHRTESASPASDAPHTVSVLSLDEDATMPPSDGVGGP